MAIKPGNKKDITKSAGQVSPRFRVVRSVSRAHRINGRLKRGNRFSILPQPGRIVPSQRAKGPTSAANLFEATGAMSQTRTIQCHADAALRVVASVFIKADSRAWVACALERLSDAGQWIVRPIQWETDLALQINRLLSTPGDTHQAVFVRLEKSSDSRQLVVRSEAREAVTLQTVFAALIRESQEIQT